MIQEIDSIFSMNITIQELVNRFSTGTAGGHLKYVGYKSRYE